MTIDLLQIPEQRLALLDTLTLYHGQHGSGTGGPDCKHCARELLHEVVTGRHADRTPDGVSVMVSMLPALNDGPWLDDSHRTRVMRPYLRKMLALDPAKDLQRVYAIIDHLYRRSMPDVCDALKLHDDAKALRALTPITDRKTALDARAARAARAALDALAALAALDARAARAARAALDALDALDARAALDALAALDARAALDACARSEAWETGVTAILDLVCGIN